MPRYKFMFEKRSGKLTSLGTLFFNDDAEAIEEFKRANQLPRFAELTCPDRKRRLAHLDEQGRVVVDQPPD